MTFLLDTDTCIGILTGRCPAAHKTLRSLQPGEISVSTVVRAELFYGAAKSRDPEQALRVHRAFVDQYASVPFDDTAAEAYGHIRANLELKGTPIGPNDLLIAAVAVAHGLTLVTHNTKEFDRVESLDLVDWAA